MAESSITWRHAGALLPLRRGLRWLVQTGARRRSHSVASDEGSILRRPVRGSHRSVRSRLVHCDSPRECGGGGDSTPGVLAGEQLASISLRLSVTTESLCGKGPDYGCHTYACV